MRNQGRTLIDRMYGSVKRGVGMIAVAGLGYMGMSYFAPSKADAQVTRVTEREDFNGSITKSNVRAPSAKWTVGASDLECSDFDSGGAGYEFFHFNDKLYNFNTNLCVEIDARKDIWGNDQDKIFAILSGSPTDGTYYLFAINAHPDAGGQWWINRRSPGLNHTYLNGFSNLINKGNNVSNKLTVSHDVNGWHFKINGSSVLSEDENRQINERLPVFEGYVGNGGEDANGGNDPELASKFLFNYHISEFDQQGGGGGQVKDPSIPHIPEVFKRGDSNRDGTVDIADPIHTLQYLFLDGSGTCMDAMDVNDDGSVDISDPVFTLFNLFVSGESYKIPPPNMGGRGIDLTADSLNCEDGKDPTVWNQFK